MVRTTKWRTSCTLSEDMMFFHYLLYIPHRLLEHLEAAFTFLYQMSVSAGSGCGAADVKLRV